MAQICKLEMEMEIKSSLDRLFDIYKNKASLLAKISPDKLESIQVLEGDGKSVGSLRLWTYVMGTPVIAMDKIEAVDEKNRSISFILVGGEVMKFFKSLKATLQANLDADKNLAKWTLEYEKANDDVPTPHSHLDFLVSVSKEVDAYLLKTK